LTLARSEPDCRECPRLADSKRLSCRPPPSLACAGKAFSMKEGIAQPRRSHGGAPPSFNFSAHSACLVPQVEQCGPASRESREAGRGNPSHQARSQLHWGRVACAHVQPATVKAHAPMMS